jgi:hypothetical protein
MSQFLQISFVAKNVERKEILREKEIRTREFTACA